MTWGLPVGSMATQRRSPDVVVNLVGGLSCRRPVVDSALCSIAAVASAGRPQSPAHWRAPCTLPPQLPRSSARPS
eukprot:6509697-Pyramimonas_sp.AAC.1